MTMYGKWFLSVTALGAIVLFVVGLASAFSALVAVAIALLVAVVLLYAFAARRSRLVGAEHATAAGERR